MKKGREGRLVGPVGHWASSVRLHKINEGLSRALALVGQGDWAVVLKKRNRGREVGPSLQACLGFKKRKEIKEREIKEGAWASLGLSLGRK